MSKIVSNIFHNIDPRIDLEIDSKIDPEIDPKFDPKIDSKIDPKFDFKIVLNAGFTFPHVIETIGLLICTLISENQGLENLWSVLNLRKISGPAHLDFFSVCHRIFFRFMV